MATGSVRPTQKTIRRICSQLDEYAALGADPGVLAARSDTVSAWSVGEQLEHLRKSDLTILAALDGLDAETPSAGSPNLVGRLVLLTGFIPRGRGRAPGATRPLTVDAAALAPGLSEAKRRFAALEERLPELLSLPGKIQHPALGRFSAHQMLAFTAIHHHHHAKIIAAIRRSVAVRSGS